VTCVYHSMYVLFQGSPGRCGGNNDACTASSTRSYVDTFRQSNDAWYANQAKTSPIAAACTSMWLAAMSACTNRNSLNIPRAYMCSIWQGYSVLLLFGFRYEEFFPAWQKLQELGYAEGTLKVCLRHTIYVICTTRFDNISMGASVSREQFTASHSSCDTSYNTCRSG